MTRQRIEEISQHPFVSGLAPEHVDMIARHAKRAVLLGGQRVFVEGEPAHRWWMLCDGRLHLEIHAPGKGELLVESLGEGDILGWSWLFPPYRWRLGALAVADTHAFEVEAAALRAACEKDPAFGREMYRRFAEVAVDRLQATRIRALDLYEGGGRMRDAL